MWIKKYNLILISLVILFFNSINCLYFNVNSGTGIKKSDYVFGTKHFKVLGTVEAKGAYSTWFKVGPFGKTAYTVIKQKAVDLGGNDFINYRFESHNRGIFLVYEKTKWNAFATVIQYRDEYKSLFPTNLQEEDAKEKKKRLNKEKKQKDKQLKKEKKNKKNNNETNGAGNSI